MVVSEQVVKNGFAKCFVYQKTISIVNIILIGYDDVSKFSIVSPYIVIDPDMQFLTVLKKII